MRNTSLFNIFVLGLALLSGCADHRESAAVYLRTSVPGNAVVVTGVGSEDWFWCVLQLTPADSAVFSRTVQASSGWHAMPLPPQLIDAAGYLQPETSEFKGHIPITNTNGFYTFLDLEAEHAAKNPYPGSTTRMKRPFHERGGLNYVFGYFDNVERKIYVWWSHT